MGHFGASGIDLLDKPNGWHMLVLSRVSPTTKYDQLSSLQLHILPPFAAPWN
jgi:hypothetical protein